MSKSKSIGRSLNGLLLFDKSTGISSSQALQKVKRIFDANKAGHSGTLDPLATGLLVICFGRTTKISDYLLTANKTYQVTLKLGVVTTSGDADGEILEENDCNNISREDLRDTASQFIGDIEQIPPMHSALKHQGRRLYTLARKGIEVERKPRKVTIHRFELLHMHNELVTMHVECSKGTYVRTLVEDLGKLLGCGAHITQLRRTALGPFVEPKMYTMQELQRIANHDQNRLDTLLLSTDEALSALPEIVVDHCMMLEIQHGRKVKVPDGLNEKKARIYDENHHFYGVASINLQGEMRVKRLT